MKKALGLSAVALLLLSCGNKIRQEHEPAMVEAESEEALQQPDTIVTEEVKGKQKEVKASSTPTPASSHSHESSDYDNMRGFDPATEDDMDDNGMSRLLRTITLHCSQLLCRRLYIVQVQKGQEWVTP